MLKIGPAQGPWLAAFDAHADAEEETEEEMRKRQSGRS